MAEYPMLCDILIICRGLHINSGRDIRGVTSSFFVTHNTYKDLVGKLCIIFKPLFVFLGKSAYNKHTETISVCPSVRPFVCLVS